MTIHAKRQQQLMSGLITIVLKFIAYMDMQYKLISEERYAEVIHHLRDTFFFDEPLNKAAGLCQQGQGNPALEHYSCETLKDNLSLMAVNQNDAIAGVILNGVLRPGDIELAQTKLELSKDENFKKVFQLLYSNNMAVNIFEKFNTEKIFDVRVLSVDPRYRGHGIAKELVHRSEQLAKDFDFKLMKADATGLFSQKILMSNGFQILNEQYYSKYRDRFGNPVLNVEGPHIKLQLLYKLLN